MVITNLLVTGSVVYAGMKTVVNARRSANITQTATSSPSRFGDSVPQTAASPVETVLNEPTGLTLAERRHLTLAATSFWLAMGGLLFPPLTVASVPLTVYTTVPILEAGCRAIYSEGRLKPSVINSILLVSTLMTNHYLSAATIAWLHHTFRQLGRKAQLAGEVITTEINNEMGDLMRQALGGTPRMVWVVKDTVEVKSPFAEVAIGDIIVVNRGEFIPVVGTVTAGTAKVNTMLLTRSATPVEVGVGEKVYPTAFVMEGHLRIQVEQVNN